MSKELGISDFSESDALRFYHLSTKTWTKLELLKLFDLYAIQYLVKKNILVTKANEQTGLLSYEVRDGFIDG